MKKFPALAAALAAIPLAAVALTPTIAAAETLHEITVTIEKVKAADRIDNFSRGDFYARVTIDGDRQNTPFVRQNAEITPNWQISKKVKPGKYDVKVEIFDKDVSVDDKVDINRLGNKRDLDFAVDTRKCRITGFAQTYKCGQTITRTGSEKKAAELSFKVTVKK
jgi:uncharacterized protein (DUF2141 family)